VMNLNFDANTAAGVLDFAFRWANPTVGDRIAQLTSLIGSGRIVVSSPISVSVFGIGDGYTYIGVNPNPNFLVGDYNEDGVVNAADYVTWRDHLNAPEGTLPNDISVGSIGESQYLVWKSRFGNELSEGSVESTAVPEPSFAVLLLLVSPALKCFTRRHPLNLRRVEGSY